MLLTNLAEPEWITVDCNKPITKCVLCLNEKESKNLARFIETEVYNTACILLNNTCCLFEWYHMEETITQKITNRLVISNITMFQHLFDAVGANLPPILINPTYVMIYHRYGSIYNFMQKKTVIKLREGLTISTQGALPIHLSGNTFKCPDDVFISVKFICNGINDCSGDNLADEIGYECDNKVYLSK